MLGVSTGQLLLILGACSVMMKPSDMIKIARVGGWEDVRESPPLALPPPPPPLLPYIIHGFNTYWLMSFAAIAEATDAGLNVCRTWAFNDGGYRALQTAPFCYDDEVFQVVKVEHCERVHIIAAAK